MNKTRRHRRFIQMAGERHWCIAQAGELISALDKFTPSILWCGDSGHIPAGIVAESVSISTRRSDVENLLGSQFSILVINAFDGFNPELFCALAGTIKVPGIVILLTPHPDDWPDYPDPDYRRLCSWPACIDDIPGRFLAWLVNRLAVPEQAGQLTLLVNTLHKNSINNALTDIYNYFSELTLDNSDSIKLTDDQERLIDAVRKLAMGKQTGIIVVEGNRGRGKSTALGIAINPLFDPGRIKQLTVVVISQSVANAQAIFNQAGLSGLQSRQLLYHLPPDQALLDQRPVGLAIVDEAASIPLPILYQLIVTYPKLVLSTTTDGYEGTGKGFVTKLQASPLLRSRLLDHIELKQPFRWEHGDPLESFILNQLIATHQHTAEPVRPAAIDADTVVIKNINRDELVHDNNMLEQVYRLLASAHYRTTPDDLRYFLDAPDVALWAALTGNTVCATLVACHEGNLPEQFCMPVILGERRLKGHLLPQTLAANSGIKDMIRYSYRRIIRIAVSAPYRNQGIGLRMIQALTGQANDHECDFTGASFGLEPGLYDFWRKSGFVPARLGYRANARSGLRSLVMLRPLSSRAESACQALQNQFDADIRFDLERSPHDQVLTLFNTTTASGTNLQAVNDKEYERVCVHAFAFGHRQFESCHRLLYQYALKQPGPDEDVPDLVRRKVLDNQSWQECALACGYSGKSALLKDLRQYYKAIYSAAWGNSS